MEAASNDNRDNLLFRGFALFVVELVALVTVERVVGVVLVIVEGVKADTLVVRGIVGGFVDGSRGESDTIRVRSGGSPRFSSASEVAVTNEYEQCACLLLPILLMLTGSSACGRGCRA